MIGPSSDLLRHDPPRSEPSLRSALADSLRLPLRFLTMEPAR